jgi:hypothetical protein
MRMQPMRTRLAHLGVVVRAVDVDEAAHGVHVAQPVEAGSLPESHRMRVSIQSRPG